MSYSDFGSSKFTAFSENGNYSVGWGEIWHADYEIKLPHSIKKSSSLFSHALLYDFSNDKLKNIGNLSKKTNEAQFRNARAMDISADGQYIVGWSETDHYNYDTIPMDSSKKGPETFIIFHRHAFLYSNEIMYDLGTLDEGNDSEAHSITDDGRIIYGLSTDKHNNWRQVIWKSNKISNEYFNNEKQKFTDDAREKERLAEIAKQQEAQAEKERLAKEQADKAKAEQERLAKEQADKANAEQERLAKEQADKAKAEQERLAKEQADKVKAEQERLAKEQADKAKAEQERLAKEQADKANAEQERLAKEQADKAKAEQERLAKEQADKVKAEQERLAKEQADKAKAEQERLAKEQADKAKAEQERLAKEQADKVKAEQERLAKEQADKAKAEQERLAKEQADKVKAEQERLAKEQADKVKAEQERLAKEQAEEKTDTKPPVVISKPIDIENTYKSIQLVAENGYKLIDMQQGQLRYLASATCSVGTKKSLY
ncbi:autotransporter [Proteus vulgaris]|nr:autotransporter [Proteus vulgaris]